MSRRRYLSTDAGRDKALYRVAAESLFAHSLYLLAIPSAGDDCALPSNDPDELLWEVWPSVARDYDAGQVEAAIELLVHVGLWEYGPDGRLRFPPAKFYKHQTYIREDRRGNARSPQASDGAPRETAQPSINKEAGAHNGAEQRKSAQNPASFSFSSSSSVPSSSSPPPAATQPPGGVAPDADAPDALSLELVPPEPVPKPERKRDLIFEAFLEIFAGGSDTFLTDPERAKWNVAAKGFRKLAASKGIPDEQIAGLIHQAHENWGNVKADLPETPNGLLTNFASLLNGPQVNGRSNGTVRQHTQKVTESALVARNASLAELRAQRRLPNANFRPLLRPPDGALAGRVLSGTAPRRLRGHVRRVCAPPPGAVLGRRRAV